jgi:hypothetical protein
VSNAPSKPVSFSRPKVGYFSNRPRISFIIIWQGYNYSGKSFLIDNLMIITIITTGHLWAPSHISANKFISPNPILLNPSQYYFPTLVFISYMLHLDMFTFLWNVYQSALFVHTVYMLHLDVSTFLWNIYQSALFVHTWKLLNSSSWNITFENSTNKKCLLPFQFTFRSDNINDQCTWTSKSMHSPAPWAHVLSLQHLSAVLLTGRGENRESVAPALQSCRHIISACIL